MQAGRQTTGERAKKFAKRQALKHAVRQRGRQALKKTCKEAGMYRGRLAGSN